MTEHDRVCLHNFKTKFRRLFQWKKSFNILIRYAVLFSLRIRMGLLKLLVSRATLFVVLLLIIVSPVRFNLITSASCYNEILLQHVRSALQSMYPLWKKGPIITTW